VNNRLIQRMLGQVAVYWVPTGKKDDHGRPLWSDPIEIFCRWDNVTEQFMDKNGDLAVSNAKVYVDREVDNDGVLWLSSATRKDPPGTALGELRDDANPFAQDHAFFIRRRDDFPNRRFDNTMRTCYL